jgi:phosphoglycerol transferase MdoB-like AlkP superfamily enzyme
MKNAVYILIQAILVLLLIEAVHRGSIIETFSWVNEKTRAFAYNLLIIYLLFLGLRILKIRLYLIVSLILTSLLTLLSFASHVKQSIRGEPLLPTDLLLGSEARNMMEFFSLKNISVLVIFVLFFIVLIFAILRKVRVKEEINWKLRSVSLLLLVTFTFLLAFEYTKGATKMKEFFMIEYVSRDQKVSYQTNGLLSGFLLNYRWIGPTESIGYSKEKVESLTEKIQYETEVNNEKPNVIMIMSEAFWDPTILDNLIYNKDPLPNFHRLSQEHTSGLLNVSVFGGSTVNTEFEVLTGLSTQFLPPGVIPYVQYVDKPIPSLPYLFRNSGYDTTGIHSYHHWFYDRSNAYKNLGFDQFVSLEYFDNPIYPYTFIHDKSINEEILKKLNTNQSPHFIFAVTTQNHGPYSMDPNKDYSDWEFSLKDGSNLSDESVNILNTLFDNLEEIDQELINLIEEVKKVDRKTIIVFWGDHLPLLGDDYKVYRETGFFKDIGTYEEYQKMYSTPVVIWDNFSNNNDKINLSSNFLGAMTLDRAGVQGNYVTNYLNQALKGNSVSRIPREDFLAEEHIDEEVFAELKLLQYDILFGEQWGITEKNIYKVNNKYRLGYENPKIDFIQEEKRKSKQVLKIVGSNFPGRCEVFVNGKLVEKIASNTKEIFISVPKKEGEYSIQVRVLDSNNKVLSKSNTFKYLVD